MYLLILCQRLNTLHRFSIFTFHNVSINSDRSLCWYQPIHYLHSIMYLLIPDARLQKMTQAGVFTFHNVSINSFIKLNLLGFRFRFTFHNVSINSRPPTTIISSIVFLLFLSTSFYSPHLTSIFLL